MTKKYKDGNIESVSLLLRRLKLRISWLRLKLLDSKPSKFLFYKKQSIPLAQILLGAEGQMPGWQYAMKSNDLARCSTRVVDGPHYEFLMDYMRLGQEVFVQEIYCDTSYYKNVEKCIDIYGEYFPGISNPLHSTKQAKHFVNQYDQVIDFTFRDNPIMVTRIANTDFFQLVDGNHRAAINLARGQENIYALVHRWKRQITPILFLLDALRWESGEKVLYQPLPFPELSKGWATARLCSDRFDLMYAFLRRHKIYSGEYLDIGAYYGWFLNEFANVGFNCTGVEKDRVAVEIGTIAYPKIKNKIVINDASKYLRETDKCFDIISCLSVIHHQITGRERGNALETLKEIDSHTSRVLFFEMGEETELWFKDQLPGWNPDSIFNWVMSNTSFTHGYVLGKDSDGIGKFINNYGRTLFAFTKE